MAYRRRPKADGPLTPTPLYTICEPIPDYLSSIVEADAIYRWLKKIILFIIDEWLEWIEWKINAILKRLYSEEFYYNEKKILN